MLQKRRKKPPASPSINQKPFTHTLTDPHAPPTFLILLWIGLWLPEKYIAEGQRKKNSGFTSANPYSFETCPMDNLVSS